MLRSQNISRRAFIGAGITTAAAWGSESGPAGVSLKRLPEGCLQPQAAQDTAGAVHLIYYRGDPLAGDLFYERSHDGGATFSPPLRINRRPGAAVAAGSVRGGHLAIGQKNRIHIAWNGSKDAQPRGPKGAAPMLYTRSNLAGTGFEPERNVIQTAYGLDGGGSVAADPLGNVYVLWHAPSPGEQGEDRRRIWVARSTDNGAAFEPETPAGSGRMGACGCCGMAAFASPAGNLYTLYRSAFETVHRDMYLLSSRDRGLTFDATQVGRWEVGYCVMSTATFAAAPDRVLAAWETNGQIGFARIDPRSGTILDTGSAPGEAPGRKHPALAANTAGDFLLAWTEGTAWKKGGSLAWQVYDRNGRPKGDPGKAPGVPPFSLISAYARPDGAFTVVY